MLHIVVFCLETKIWFYLVKYSCPPPFRAAAVVPVNALADALKSINSAGFLLGHAPESSFSF